MGQFDLQTALQLIQNGNNPQELMMNYLSNQLGGSPLGANLMNLAQKGDDASIERIARNICAERGMDYDKEFSAFKKSLGIR